MVEPLRNEEIYSKPKRKRIRSCFDEYARRRPSSYEKSIGIIRGLQKYEEESSSDFAGWVEDAPGEYIETVVEEWKKSNPSEEDIAEIMSIVRSDR